jgi:hypothetical protein
MIDTAERAPAVRIKLVLLSLVEYFFLSDEVCGPLVARRMR